MSYSRKKYREDTLFERIQVHNGILAGLNERRAIEAAFPARDASGKRMNTNRMAKLARWRDKGLWPVTQEDLNDAQEMGLLASAAAQTDTTANDIRELMRARVGSGSARWQDNRRGTVHLGARVPIEIVTQLRQLPGTVTENMIQALTLFLEA